MWISVKIELKMLESILECHEFSAPFARSASSCSKANETVKENHELDLKK